MCRLTPFKVVGVINLGKHSDNGAACAAISRNRTDCTGMLIFAVKLRKLCMKVKISSY